MLKNRILTAILLLSCINLFSQEPLKHEKKFFTAKSGRFYIQKSMPLYFRISNSPNENAKSHLLTSETYNYQVKAFYFAKDGLNVFKHPARVDTVTKLEVHGGTTDFQIYADGTSPVTNHEFSKTPTYTKNNTVFFGKNLEVSLTSKDEVSGVEQIFYSIDKAIFANYSGNLKFDKEKSYEFKYYAVDNVGNDENVTSKSFYVDLTSPVSNLKFTGDLIDTIISGRSLINLSSTDALTDVNKINYKFDGEGDLVYSKPISGSVLSEGEHEIIYYATDNVKNVEKENKLKFFVDKTAPIIVEELLGDTYVANGKEFSSGRTKLKLTAIDNRAGVKGIYYSINNGKYLLYDKPFYLSSQKGNLVVKSYAVDNVNNQSLADQSNNASQLYRSYVDLAGPDLSYSYEGETFKMRDTVYISDRTKIKLKAIDPESGLNRIVYNLDGSPDTVYHAPFTIKGNGLHKIDYFGYDNVSNSNQANFFCKVDQTGPEINYQFSMPPYNQKVVNGKAVPVYQEHALLYIMAFDAVSGVDKIYYTLNNEPEKLYSNFLQKLKKGQYSLKLRSIDKLGNQTTKEVQFEIQ